MTRAQQIHDEIASMIEVKYATQNGAYKAGTNINASGAVNHSIGCAQPSADVMYNHMNQETAGWGVTAILGDFHKGPGRIILALPMERGKCRRNWGVGAGSKGSYNNSRVQWEICEPSGHTYAGGTMIGYNVAENAEYFARMWTLLVKWNVYVAVELGLTTANICDHAESYKAGMGSNHSDLGHWLPKHGKSMDDLRAEVAAILEDKEEVYHTDITKEELKALIREVINEENPVYQDLKDVPEYWKPAAAALLDAGAVNGGTPAEVCATDLNLRKETLKAAVVAVMYHDARERAGAGE